MQEGENIQLQQQEQEQLYLKNQQSLQQQPISHNNQTNISIQIATQTIQTLLQSFQYQLKVNSLMKHISQFNTAQLHRLNQQCVAYFYLQGQSKSSVNMRNYIMGEDKMPKNISKDGLVNVWNNNNNSNNDINIINNINNNINNNNNSLILPVNTNTNHSLNYSASKSRYDQQKQDKCGGIQNNNNNDKNIKKAVSFQVIRVNQFKESSQLFCNQPQSISPQIQSSSIKPQSIIPAHPIPLKNLPQQRQKPNIQLQTQLQHIKKNLYQLRRYRKISIEQQRANIDKINHKKSHLLYGKLNHTYDYDGGLMPNNISNNSISSSKRKNDNNGKNLNDNDDHTSLFDGILQLKTNSMAKSNTQRNRLSLNKRYNNNNKNNPLLNFSTSEVTTTFNDPIQNFQDTNPQRNLTSQQKNQKVSFNNGNKRQVSHLPFISLKDNAKVTFYQKQLQMIENKKQLSGSVTQRHSLYRSKVSMSNPDNNNSHIKFRSFSQIEQQKRLQKSKQKAMDFTEQQQGDNNMLGIDILPPTLLNLNSQDHSRKQSKMMQKYLKKLTQQKTKIQKMIQKDSSRLKSVNFEQVVIPQKYPIQRYYEYDYEGQKRAHQYSIVSKLSTKRNSLSVANQTEGNY